MVLLLSGLYVSLGNERKSKDQAVFGLKLGKIGNYKELDYQERIRQGVTIQIFINES